MSLKNDKLEKHKNIGTVAVEYYFDYNTVEKVLLMSAILLCLCAIMFKSGKFDNLYSEEDIFMQGLLITFAGGTIIFSLVYYMTVLISEATGYLPSFIKRICGHEKAKQKRLRNERKSVVQLNSVRNRSGTENMLHKNIELKTLNYQNNPLRGKLEKTSKEKKNLKKERKKLEKEKDLLRAKNQALVERLRQAKKTENRHAALNGKGSRRGGSRSVSFHDDYDDNDGSKKQRRKRIKKKKMGQTMMSGQ